MKCREFREISESYLSDELLVETHHQVNHHLEHCSDCRTDFASRRALRRRVSSAAVNAAEFRIDPSFATGLKNRLREDALGAGLWTKLSTSRRVLIPIVASLLIAFGFGSYYLSSLGFGGPNGNDPLSNGVAELVHFASGNHKDCALEKLARWERMSETDYPEKAVYSDKILAPLKEKYSDSMEMLSVHDCEFRGKEFTHVVVRNGRNIVSVFFDKTDVVAESRDGVPGPITSEFEDGLQVASFAQDRRAVFVVSDLSETENLNMARVLSHSFRQTS
ncbi:MAG: hypothetical protein ABI857_00160 [Acidobacteriota bacterium]